MNLGKKNKRQKAKDGEIKDLLTDLEQDLGNFKLNIDEKDKKIKEYINLLALARTEYKKVVQENNLLKRQLLGLKSAQQAKQKKKTPIKRRYIVAQSDSDADSELVSDTTESEEEQKKTEVRIKKAKEKNKRNTNKKQKLFDFINKKE